MKKIYMKPSAQVVKIEENIMLEGSVGGETGSAGIKRVNTYDFEYEEED